MKKFYLLLTMLLTLGIGQVWGAEEYALYSGTITEGDYIIVSEGYAMNNTVTSSRLGNTAVTVTSDKISNPPATIVWHIAPSGGYWTIFSANVNKYAASTGAKNKAQLLASGTDDKSLWTVSGSSTYEFVNKANDAANVNKNLRRNGEYGFACYATSTGGALSLYKKVEQSGGGETPEPTPDPEEPDPTPGAGSSTGWVETAIANIASSDLVVVTMTSSSGTYAMSNDKGTGAAPAAVSVTVNGDKLAAEPADNLKWNITYSSGNLTIYPNGDNAKWLYCTATNNGTRVGTNANKIFTIDATSGYLKNTATNRYIGVYNNQDWRCYTSTTTNIANQTLKFYKYVEPTGGGDEPETPTPSVSVSPASHTFATTNVGETATQVFEITAENTTETLSAEISNTTDYAISAIADNKITVTYQPQTAETHEATLTIKAGEEASTTVALTGKAKTPLAPIAGGVIDILNQDWTDVTGTNYTDVAAKTAENEGHSNAQYVAQCAGDKSSIQLRSNNSNSGVVSTISGGVVKRIEVEWHADTDAARTLQIYGSNTAYTAATDLYGDAKGELLGELNKGEGETTLDFSEWTGDYKYIGFRSKSGAMYLTTVTITWLPTISKVTIDDQIENGSVSVSGAADLNSVVAGIELTLSNTPATDYKLAAYDVYKTGEETTKVTVTDGKFIMPEFDVTISATFEQLKELDKIEVNTTNVKTTFWQGETFNSTGLVVTAYYTDETSTTVTPKSIIGSTAEAGTKQVTVSYTEGEITKETKYDITVKAIANNEETPYTVIEAREIIDAVGETTVDVYVQGIVSKIVTAYNSEYGNISYNISEDGKTTSAQLQAYRGKSYNGDKFTSADDIQVDDKVVVKGKLKKYDTTYEFAQDNQLVSLVRSTEPKPTAATLPFEFDGKKADIDGTVGMTQEGIDSDYNSAPYLKFNTAGDWAIVQFDSEPGEFSFLLKQNGQNAGTFTVYESANGEDYTPIWSGGDLGGNGKSATIEPTLSATARYVKLEYTTKGESTNYGLGSISIQKADHRAEAGIAWNPATISLTVGDAFTAPTFSKPNNVTGVTFTSDNEALATVDNAGAISLVSGKTGTATITATYAGNETYKPAEVKCTITVNKAQLPTGTFALYSGEIVEGDYVITYENNAMKAADDDDSDRLDFDEIAPVDNKINNPSSMIVWHVLPSGEYWAIYNEYVEKYAASITATKNKATLVDEVNDNAKWSLSGDEAYDFVNYERANSTTDNSNKYLRKNNEYGFACYAQATGGKLTLYRKQTPHTVTVAACTNGSVSVSNVVDTKALSGDIITLSNTPDFDYLFVGYNVYKTGDETTVITVTNGTFTMPAFDVTISATFEAIQQTAKTLSGKFSTGEYEYAEFATGNLQYKKEGENETWRFAKQQYQVVGEDNIYVGKTDYEGWIDMFGWSNGDANNFGVNASNDNQYYTGTFVDWGTIAELGEGWSTLSKDQWDYLLNERDASLKQIAKVGDMLGIMLFPDNWTYPDGCEVEETLNHDPEDGENTKYDFYSYNYTLAQWTELEKAGAVFLPAAGRRTGGWGNTTISPHMVDKIELDADGHYKYQDNTNYHAYYWTSTYRESDKTATYLHNIKFLGNNDGTVGQASLANEQGRYGQSVRLAKVTDITPVVIRDGLTVGQWGTLCPTQNVENPTGATFYQIAYLEEKDKQPFNMHFDQITATTLIAGQPYFFIASATQIKGVKSGEEKNEGSNVNGFYGYIGETSWTLPYQASFDVNNNNTFVIWNNSVFRINAETSIKSERCYININSTEPIRTSTPAPVGARRITMGVSGVNGQNTATGMENIDASAQPVKTIINGQLYILRGEKMYDAQGKLVK